MHTNTIHVCCNSGAPMILTVKDNHVVLRYNEGSETYEATFSDSILNLDNLHLLLRTAVDHKNKDVQLLFSDESVRLSLTTRCGPVFTTREIQAVVSPVSTTSDPGDAICPHQKIIYGHQATKDGSVKTFVSAAVCNVLSLSLGSSSERYRARYYQQAVWSIEAKIIHVQIGFNCGKTQMDAVRNPHVETLITTYSGYHHNVIETLLSEHKHLPNLKRVVFTAIQDHNPEELYGLIKNFPTLFFVHDVHGNRHVTQSPLPSTCTTTPQAPSKRRRLD